MHTIQTSWKEKHEKINLIHIIEGKKKKALVPSGEKKSKLRTGKKNVQGK